jgi:hypothetical protein
MTLRFFFGFIAFPLAIPQGAFLVHVVPNGRAKEQAIVNTMNQKGSNLPGATP